MQRSDSRSHAGTIRSELPPIRTVPAITGFVQLFMIRSDSFLNYPQDVGIVLCLRKVPVVEADHPSTRLVRGMAVEVCTVQVGEEAMSVARIALRQGVGFRWFGDTSYPTYHIADPCCSCIRWETDRFVFGLIVGVRGDDGYRTMVKDCGRAIRMVCRSTVSFDAHQIDFDGCLTWRWDEAFRERYPSALGKDNRESAFARIPLPDRVGCDEPQPSTGCQHGNGAMVVADDHVEATAPGGLLLSHVVKISSHSRIGRCDGGYGR